MAACNPYKLKNGMEESQGLKLDKGIIGIQSNLSKENEKLVYAVFPLAESMFNFVWDYDKLEESDEKEYVEKIIY